MKPRFEPDNQSGSSDGLSPTLVDPEAYDASEQTFAASLEQTVPSKPSRFVVEKEALEVETGTESESPGEEASAGKPRETGAVALLPAEVQELVDPESWRREVAARLSHYRARRRPREPRYPSLQLKFETEPVWSDPILQAPAGVDQPLAPTPTVRRVAESMQTAAGPRIRLAEPADYPRAIFAATNEATAKVIEFASYSAAPRPLDELAEPVLDRPRIIEAPELEPPPPALGGISIEPVEEPASERRPGFEIPLRPAPMGRRVAAAGIDATLVIAAIAAFAYSRA